MSDHYGKVKSHRQYNTRESIIRSSWSEIPKSHSPEKKIWTFSVLWFFLYISCRWRRIGFHSRGWKKGRIHSIDWSPSIRSSSQTMLIKKEKEAQPSASDIIEQLSTSKCAIKAICMPVSCFMWIIIILDIVVVAWCCCCLCLFYF